MSTSATAVVEAADPEAADDPLGVEPPAGGRRRTREDALVRRRTRRRRIRRLALASVVLSLAVVGWSIGHALMRANHDPVGVTLVEWARDHGGGTVVNDIEAWWYGNHQPPKGGSPRGGIPHVARPVAARPVTPPPTVDPRDLPPAAVTPFVATPLPGEGVWQPTGKIVGGVPAVYQTFLRPDAVHTSLLAGLIRMNGHVLAARQYNGTDVPGGGPWTYGDHVAPADDATLVAAFNGGFRLDASNGGYLAEGRSVRGLVPGRASLVIGTDGTATVAMWGRDAVAGPGVASVRQNLDLIVDHGAPVPGLNANDTSRWGATLGGKIFVWRSGVGVDAQGNLIYVAGELDIASLANVLARAGAVRAMELDINSEWVSGYVYTGTGPADTVGVKLLGSIQRPADRYLVPGSRDFVALFARP